MKRRCRRRVPSSTVIPAEHSEGRDPYSATYRESQDYGSPLSRGRQTSGSNLTLESRMGFPSDLPNVVVGFQAAISRFVAEANDDPKPFTWLADPNKSIVAVRRGYQVLDSIH